MPNLGCCAILPEDKWLHVKMPNKMSTVADYLLMPDLRVGRKGTSTTRHEMYGTIKAILPGFMTTTQMPMDSTLRWARPVTRFVAEELVINIRAGAYTINHNTSVDLYLCEYGRLWAAAEPAPGAAAEETGWAAPGEDEQRLVFGGQVKVLAAVKAVRLQELEMERTG